ALAALAGLTDPEAVIGPRTVLALGALLAVSLAAAAETDGLRGTLLPEETVIPTVTVTPPVPPKTDDVVTGGVPQNPSANPVAAKARPVAERVTPQTPVETSDAAKGIITGPDLRRHSDEDPYAPLGIRVGTFIYYPAVTVSGGYTTNAQAK